MKSILFKLSGLLTGIIMILTTSVLSGCKKFLDRKPLSATATDVSGVEGEAMGLYFIFEESVGFNGLPWLDFNSIRDDDAQKGSSSTDGAEIVTEFETFQYTKDDWATNTYWNEHYNLINKANKLLFNAKKLGLTDAGSLINMGEAHFFRAYSYFELVKAYGQVPLIDYYYEDPRQGIRPKATIPELYALIDRDLDSAVLLLPFNWNGSGPGNTNIFKGRLTKWAAKGLSAQTHLFRSEWAKVLGLCNEIMASGEFALLAKFVDVWKDDIGGAGKNSKESVLEMQASIDPGGANDYGSWWGVQQNVRRGGAGTEWDLGWGWNTPTDKLETEWPNSDPRKRQTILYSGQYDGGAAEGGFGATLPPYGPGSSLDQKYWNKKVYTGNSPAMRSSIGIQGYPDWINRRVIRYAEIILMKAEAANETGDGTTAAAMLELIRARARNGNNAVLPPVAFVSQSQMRQAIKDERRWEFAMEGVRFYDLVRWGDAEAALGILGYTPRCALYPIPQKAIDFSGGVLTQNPQW